MGIDKKTKAEFREWLGLTKADLMVYIALFLVIAGCFLNSAMTFFLLFLGSIFFGSYAAMLGMPKNKNLSDFTNLMKKISYPILIFVLLTVMAVKILFYLDIFSF